MLDLNTSGFSPDAVKALTIEAPLHAEKLTHRTMGSDDALLGIMSVDQCDGGTTSVLDFFYDEFNLSRADVQDAILEITGYREEDPYNGTGASDGVGKALRLARKSARHNRSKWYTKITVTPWDILVGLIQANDETFQLVMLVLTLQFDDFSFKKLEDRVLRGIKQEPHKVPLHAMS